MAEKTKAQLAQELAAAEKKSAAAEKRIAAAEAKAAAAEEEAAAAKKREERQTATAVAEPPKKKKRRTLQERLGHVRAGGQLSKGEHMMDLVRIRNATNLDQVVTTDDNRRVKLLGKGITDKSAVMADKSGDPDHAELVEFKGGTCVLSRKLAIPLLATGVIEIIELVDEADPDDYEEDDN